MFKAFKAADYDVAAQMKAIAAFEVKAVRPPPAPLHCPSERHRAPSQRRSDGGPASGRSENASRTRDA